jgi:hypothetical protein
MLAHTCKSSIWKVEGGGSWVWGQPGLHGEFQATLGYIARVVPYSFYFHAIRVCVCVCVWNAYIIFKFRFLIWEKTDNIYISESGLSYAIRFHLFSYKVYWFVAFFVFCFVFFSRQNYFKEECNLRPLVKITAIIDICLFCYKWENLV